MKVTAEQFAKIREYLYGLSIAVLGILVGYDKVRADQLPMWLNLMGAVFIMGTSATAALTVRRQRKSGVFTEDDQ